MNHLRVQLRRNRKRLPWKRGPIAWDIAQRADLILTQLRDPQECHRPWLSLRASARLLGVSTQPLRDWIGRGQLTRDHPRRIALVELERFVGWLRDKAEPYVEDPLDRIYGINRGPTQFGKLSEARFEWPTGRPFLTTGELAELAGCHRTLILKAIQQGWINTQQRNRYGRQWWRISRQAWRAAFPFYFEESVSRLPLMPPGTLLTTRAVAEHLGRCGAPNASQRWVRRLMARGQLKGVHPPGKHQWQVTRESVLKFRQIYKNTP